MGWFFNLFDFKLLFVCLFFVDLMVVMKLKDSQLDILAQEGGGINKIGSIQPLASQLLLFFSLDFFFFFWLLWMALCIKK
jgi:hypothetical protein